MESLSSCSDYNTDDERKRKRTESDQNKKRKQKRTVSFNKDWKETFSWIKQSEASDKFAECKICKTSFSITHGGKNDIKRHQSSSKHRKLFEDMQNSSRIDTYFCQQTLTASHSNQQKQLSVAEATHVYHTVNHSLSYRSSDCLGHHGGLYKTMFPDSQLSKMIACGRTKTTKIVKNILAPASKQIIINDLRNSNHPFSIGTDASNKGNIKTFPLVLRYFKCKEGVQTKLLSFFKSSSEASKSIFDCLRKEIEAANLSFSNVTAFTADNANVNFGGRQSVYVELKKVNANIIPVGCVCHLLHNAARAAHTLLRYDIEQIVIKCYNEFSSSSKKVEVLKEFYEWVDLEWCELLRHIPTRWLTLIPAAERLLKNFNAVKSYFLSQENPPLYVKKFFEDDLAECYLGFIVNVGQLFQSNIKRLEAENALAIDLFQIMWNIRESLQNRRKEQYYGFIASQKILQSENQSGINLFKKQAEAYFVKAIDYIEKHYDFEDNIFKYLSPLKLSERIRIEDLIQICNKFKIQNVDFDQFFEEHCKLVDFLKKSDFDENTTTEQKWVLFFKYCAAPNLEKVCNVVFSLPLSNAMSERIFSIMFNSWRKERNRLDLQTVEAELMVKQNFGMQCKDFTHFLNNTEAGKLILSKINSASKYEEEENNNNNNL